MNKIITYAIEHCDRPSRYGVLDILAELELAGMNIELAAEWLLGISNRSNAKHELPYDVKHDGKAYRLDDVRLLEDSVVVSHQEVKVRYFVYKDHADNFAETGVIGTSQYNTNKTDVCPYEGMYTSTVHEVISIETWRKWAGEQGGKQIPKSKAVKK